MSKAERESESTQATPPHRRLLEMIVGGWIAQAIAVAARLELADQLNGGPRTAREIASACGCHAAAVERLMRGLADAGLLRELPDRRYELTELGGFLRRGAERSLWATAVMMGQEHHRAWGELAHSVQTGEAAFDRVFGMPVFDYYDAAPDSAKVFHEAMGEIVSQSHDAMLAAYDFSPYELLVDVGGGHGKLLGAILQMHAHLRGIVFDQPGVVEGARQEIDRLGLGDRLTTVGGDFFADAVPVDGDCYLLSSVIHDWNDERSVQILANVRRQMRSDGRVVLAERVLKPAGEPDFARWSDLNMLVMTGGRERSVEDYAELFRQSGLEFKRVVPTRSPISLVEATAA